MLRTAHLQQRLGTFLQRSVGMYMHHNGDSVESICKIVWSYLFAAHVDVSDQAQWAVYRRLLGELVGGGTSIETMLGGEDEAYFNHCTRFLERLEI